jgi:hypothetical protein
MIKIDLLHSPHTSERSMECTSMIARFSKDAIEKKS